MILGFLLTAKSMIMGSRLMQYALLILGVIVAIMLYGARKKKEGFKEAVQEAREASVKRMEKHREKVNEIRDLPLSERARRLRALDSSE